MSLLGSQSWNSAQPSSPWATQKQRRYIESCLNRRESSLSFRRKHSVMKERKKMNRYMKKFGPSPQVSSRRRRIRTNKKASKFVWTISHLVQHIMELVGSKDLAASVRKVSHQFKFLVSVHPCIDPRCEVSSNNAPNVQAMMGYTWFERLVIEEYDIRDFFQVVYFFLHDPANRKLHDAVRRLPRNFTLTSAIFCDCLAALMAKIDDGTVELNDVVVAYAHGLHGVAVRMLDTFCRVKGFDRQAMTNDDRVRFRRIYREYQSNLEKNAFRWCNFRHEFDTHVLGKMTDDRDLRRMACLVDGFEWPTRLVPVVVVEPARGCDWRQNCCRVDASLAVDPLVFSTLGGSGGMMLAMFDMLFDRHNPYERLSSGDTILRMRILNAACHFGLAWGIEEALDLWKYQTVEYNEACLWTVVSPMFLQDEAAEARKQALFKVGGIDVEMAEKELATKKVLGMITEALSWCRLMGFKVEFGRLVRHVECQLKIKTSVRFQIRSLIKEFEPGRR